MFFLLSISSIEESRVYQYTSILEE